MKLPGLLPFIQTSPSPSRLNILTTGLVFQEAARPSQLLRLLAFRHAAASRSAQHTLPSSSLCPYRQDSFFKKLPGLLPSIPTLVAQRKLLPMLASAIEFGGAPPVRNAELPAPGMLECWPLEGWNAEESWGLCPLSVGPQPTRLSLNACVRPCLAGGAHHTAGHRQDPA